MMRLKVANASAKIPTTGAEAEKFAGKWTNSKVGQVKFGGWHEDAYEKFEENKAWISTFRTTDMARTESPGTPLEKRQKSPRAAKERPSNRWISQNARLAALMSKLWAVFVFIVVGTAAVWCSGGLFCWTGFGHGGYFVVVILHNIC